MHFSMSFMNVLALYTYVSLTIYTLFSVLEFIVYVYTYVYSPKTLSNGKSEPKTTVGIDTP